MISSSNRDKRRAPAGMSRTLRGAIGFAGLVLVCGLGAAEILRRYHAPATTADAVPADDDASALILGLADKRVTDAAGRFALTVPAAWTVRVRELDGKEAMTLRGPQGIEVWVRLADIGHDRFERMADEIQQIDSTCGVNQNIRIVTRGDRPAVERRMRLFDKEAMTLDLLVGATNHHVQLAARRERFESLQPLFRQILDSYTVGTNAPAGG
jgi:hypothetical protein